MRETADTAGKGEHLQWAVKQPYFPSIPPLPPPLRRSSLTTHAATPRANESPWWHVCVKCLGSAWIFGACMCGPPYLEILMCLLHNVVPHVCLTYLLVQIPINVSLNHTFRTGDIITLEGLTCVPCTPYPPTWLPEAAHTQTDIHTYILPPDPSPNLNGILTPNLELSINPQTGLWSCEDQLKCPYLSAFSQSVYLSISVFTEMILSNNNKKKNQPSACTPTPPYTHTDPECWDTPCHYYNDKPSRERLLERLLRVKLVAPLAHIKRSR